MKIDDIFVKEHIDRWTKAWNDHNIKEILSLYSDNILFRSPKIKSVYPDRNSATITNKKELEEYFSLGLKKYSNLKFISVDYFLKKNKVIFEYIGTPDNKIQWSVMEAFEFNSDNGLIEKSSVYYGVEEKFS
ncbi:MAG: nuclear transport factor 2 family protein [Nitrososphaeraceae archaeon]|nr:nuclear transport factor 2 family protein [Nitrososphaeraceae archaeon]